MATRTIEIHEAVHGHNDLLAARNRAKFEQAGVFVLNIMSAPGSGKTEFLARTLRDLHPGKFRMAVIVGDIATDIDAQRLAVSGAEAIQITTGGYCHLDAGMIDRAIEDLDLTALDVLIIENVGNMVCPATFDLGEHARVAVLSVTEGEDKPLKYPTLFKRSDVVIINKIDIAEVVGFRSDVVLDNLWRVAPQAYILEVSARSGEGMQDWYDRLGLMRCGQSLQKSYV